MRHVQLVLFVLGVALSALGLWGTFVSAPDPPGAYPLGLAHAAAQDSSGRIFVAIDGKNTIQIYDSSGNYEKSLSVPALKGAMRLSRGIDGQIEVAMARSEKVYRVDAASGLLSERIDANAFEQFSEPAQGTKKDDSSLSIERDALLERLSDQRTGVVYEQQGTGWTSAVPPGFALLAGVVQIVAAASIRVWWSAAARMARYRYRHLAD